MSPATLARKALTVSGWTLLSRILGLLRDRLWAGAGSGTPLLDAFIAAFQIPNTLRNLFGEGALSTAFIPRYARLKEQDPAAAEAFAGLVLGRLTVLLSLIATLLLAAATAVIWWGDLGSKAVLIATLLVPMVPFLIFICITAILGGMLNVRRHFWVAAACPVVLNLCLLTTIGLSPEREIRISPYAVLFAGFVITGLSLGALARWGGLPPLSFRMTDGYRSFRSAMVPSLLSSSVYQINALLDTVIAMVFAPGHGAVAALYYGNRLLQFPLGLIGHGVTTVAFPELSRRAGEGWPVTAEGLRSAVRLQAFWLLPAATGLLVCAEPLVRTLFQGGRFDDEAVARTVLVARFLALSLIPISISKLLVRAFHAHLDQATPLRVSLVTIGINLVLNLVLIHTPLREAGLALATTLASLLGCIRYQQLLHRRGASSLIDWRGLRRPLFAALVMAVAVETLLHLWPQPIGRGSGVAALRLGAAVGLGGLVYLAIGGTRWLRRAA